MALSGVCVDRTETSQDIQGRLFDGLTLALAILLVPVVALAWVRADELGDVGLIAGMVHTISLGLGLGAYLLRSRNAYELRTQMVLFATFCSGSTSLLMRGMQGSGILLLFLTIVLAATFGGWRRVLGFLVATAVLLSGIVVGVGLDLYAFPGDAPEANSRALSWISVSWILLVVAGGTAWILAQLIAGLRDRIRALDEARREALELERQLRHSQKLEAIGTMAGGVAHDFRNYLVPIQGHTELLLLDANSTDSHRQSLQAILAAAHGAQELCGRILSFARREEARTSPVPLVPLLEEISLIIQPSVPPGVALTVDCSGPSVAVRGAPSSVRQIVVNLCTNALHAMADQGSRLDLVLEATPPDEIPHGAPGDKTWVRLRVTDDGSGIPPEDLERIFEPYFTTKDRGEGTGLGLAMVQGLVGELGGAVQVSSEPGRGTSFVVDLPGERLERASVRDSAEGSLPRGRGELVIVVDDDHLIRSVMESLLHELGYACRTYGDSVEALEDLERHTSDVSVVLIDLTMPGLSGDELARRLRVSRPTLPVALMTGHRPDEALVDIPFIHKPPAVRDVAELLERLVGRRAGSDLTVPGGRG